MPSVLLGAQMPSAFLGAKVLSVLLSAYPVRCNKKHLVPLLVPSRGRASLFCKAGRIGAEALIFTLNLPLNSQTRYAMFSSLLDIRTYVLYNDCA